MPTTTLHCETPIQYVKGIGPKRARSLERLGYKTAEDLFYFFPRRYEDRSRFRLVRNCRIGEYVTLRGEIVSLNVRPVRKIELFEMGISDASGTIYAVWFNQGYLKKNFEVGQTIVLSGKVEYFNRLQLSSPEYEVLVSDEEETIHTGRITPIYPLTEGLWQRPMRASMKYLIDHHTESLLVDFLPEAVRSGHQLETLFCAIKNVHFPESFEELGKARNRLVFDEFFLFELALLQKREKERQNAKSFIIPTLPNFISEFEKKLPFQLTSHQKKVTAEIFNDISRSAPMRRLLQGDVGSGKTLVATMVLLRVAEEGYQTAFLVPTEILAQQHYKTISNLLRPYTIPVWLLTGSTDEVTRGHIRGELRQGHGGVLIGTHALLEENVKFGRLGFVVIDEQHKFGVKQRGSLLASDASPHLLVMTATPIPRTLGLTVYGDLDISVLGELPLGREPVKTYWITRDKEKEVFDFIAGKLKEKEQAYIVFPAIEDSEKEDLLTAKKEYERLKKGAFKDFSVGLVHGKMPSEEKTSVMKRFHSGDIQLLLATSVIEVGIDNPQASMIVIENADRFGLSQLHQIRGRVGRGTKASYCFLFGNPKTDEGKRRLRVMTKTNDGFQIAEEDFLLRGPGDFLGTRQHGMPEFMLANLALDYGILKVARQEATRLLKESPALDASNLIGLKNHFIQYQKKLRDKS